MEGEHTGTINIGNPGELAEAFGDCELAETVKEAFTVHVISRASLAQRVRRERERCERERREQEIFGQRERVISKACLAQLDRFERERLAKRARLEQDTIAKEQVTDKQKEKE